VEISRLDSDTVCVAGVDPFLLELFRGIPSAVDPAGSDTARHRIFSDPAPDPVSDLCAEWKEYVEPGLRHLFVTAADTVKEDLARFERDPRHEPAAYDLSIPRKHLDAWLNCLNQARLVIAARNEFTEADLNDEFNIFANSPRDFSLFQIHFYGLLQESFLRLMEEEGGELPQPGGG